jgi:RNA polymerase sigma factor (sigma-70 family)
VIKMKSQNDKKRSPGNVLLNRLLAVSGDVSDMRKLDLDTRPFHVRVPALTRFLLLKFFRTISDKADLDEPLYRLCLRYKRLDKEFEIELVRRFKDGDMAARDLLVKHNLWQIVPTAYFTSQKDLADLAQEGVLGCIRAMEKYDASKDVRFSHYASIWIRQYMQRYLHLTLRTIRLPVFFYDRLQQVERTLERLEQLKLDRPAEPVIAEELGLSIEEVKLCLNLLKGFDLVSLELLLQDTELAESLAMGTIHDPEMEVENTELIEFTQALLCSLSERSRLVLWLRFGLDGLPPRTQKEIGDLLGVCRERVRQIEVKAWRLLRQQYSEQAIALLSPEKDPGGTVQNVDPGPSSSTTHEIDWRSRAAWAQMVEALRNQAA